jgi:hypothetical protein
LFKALHQAGIYRRLRIAIRPIGARLVTREPAVRLEVAVLGESEIDEYLEARRDQSREQIRQRFENGHGCFVGRHQGRIVCSVWACADLAHIASLHCELAFAHDVLHVYDPFTERALRGLNLLWQVAEWRNRALEPSGYSRTLWLVPPDNAAAYRRAQRRRARIIGTVGYVAVGRWRRHFLRLRRSSDDGLDPAVSLSRPTR